MDKFLYLNKQELCCGAKDKETSRADSGYVNKYKNTVVQSIAQDNWKNSGASAQFQQRAPKNTLIEASVTGICPYTENEFLYTVQVNDVSAVLKKDYQSQAEQYIIHSNKQLFSGVSYKDGTILTAVSDDRQTRHIAKLDVASGDLNILTAGDAADGNAVYSHKDGSILFDSRGIGRNQYMQKVCEGNSSIYRISTGDFFSCDEILCEDGYDLIAPKEDKNGNLYFIRKPYKTQKQEGVKVLDILLSPFRLIYNLFRLMFFLSNIGRKSNKTTTEQSAGDNPYMSTTKSERDIYIMNEKINIEKEERANTKKGDKNPGFAPRSFELYRLDPNGNKVKIKSGVLDYDINEKNQIIYTNGRYIICLDGEEEIVLSKDKHINCVKSM